MTNAAPVASLSSAEILAALPAYLRRSFIVQESKGYLRVEHNNGYASGSQRSEELHDAERALERAGLNASIIAFASIGVFGRLAPEASSCCSAPSPSLCRCKDEDEDAAEERLAA